MSHPEPELIHRLIRRHTHDLRNHCSGIDLDATLLAELSEDPEVAATALRLKRQVSLIESDIKFLLLNLEDARPVTVSVGDLLQLWRAKLPLLTDKAHPITWPGTIGPSVVVESRLVVQVLCDLTLRTWERNPGMPMDVNVRLAPEEVVIELIQSPEGLQPPADYVKLLADLLAARGLHLSSSPELSEDRWVTGLSIPLAAGAPS